MLSFCWNNEFLSLDEKNRLDFIEKFNNLEFIKSLLNFLKIERYAFQFQKESIFDSNSLVYTYIGFIKFPFKIEFNKLEDILNHSGIKDICVLPL
jgi:hypothetical protein